MNKRAKLINASCDNTDMMNCLTSTRQSASEGQMFFPDTQQKLRDYCKNLMNGLECARRIIDECVNEEERSMYHNLTRDMVGMNVELCTPGSSLSMRFLKHVDCYKNLSDRFRVCSDRYIGNIVVVQKLSKEEQIKMTCCTVHEYSSCMRNVVENRCDVDAQKLVEETIVTALKQSFGYCKQLESNPTRNCLREFSASQGHATGTLEDTENGSSILQTPLILLLLLILFSTFVGS
ncbi:uncharacterized protein [Parasteatoda tepidariorum]|uniref:uncharacterized protein n=1 Tax=Parasteatoda tepidariorum TaxID=114398 RepID=UPI0039BD5228